eukprot:6175507-Pleurochrysis_carterae.AAC.5
MAPPAAHTAAALGRWLLEETLIPHLLGLLCKRATYKFDSMDLRVAIRVLLGMFSICAIQVPSLSAAGFPPAVSPNDLPSWPCNPVRNIHHYP